jgi:nucleoside-diphosphate-sugar epimerase
VSGPRVRHPKGLTQFLIYIKSVRPGGADLYIKLPDMQTILGSGGIIADELAKSLKEYTPSIRLVSRHPKKVNETDELFVADLLDREQTIRAIDGSEVVYLVAGLRYDYRVWQKEWPSLMENVIEGCKRAGARLVFFSNVYSLGKVDGWMTETTPMIPSSKKGKVRKQVEERLLEEISRGTIQAIIARAPDFYGPGAFLSVPHIMVFDNLKKGKRPQWLVDGRKKHSMIYTPDAGKATAILGNTPGAYNRIWHLPTCREVLTGREFIIRSVRAFDRPEKYNVLPTWMLYLVALFLPSLRGGLEMLYQNKYDYLFDGRDFEKTFGFIPTTYEDGIRQTAAAYA